MQAEHVMPTLVRPAAVPAKAVPLFSADFWSVAVFCGIGLLVSLVATAAGDGGCGERRQEESIRARQIWNDQFAHPHQRDPSTDVALIR
jgi:hypothetical protein